MPSKRQHTHREDRPKSRNLSVLRFLGRYLKRYRPQVVLALAALLFTSSAVLGLGGGLRHLVDEGLSKGDPNLLDHAFYVLVSLTLLLAVASYIRSYWMARVGEEVVAAIRRDLYRHVITLSPAYFETTRTGEILSRLTTDTTLLQAVVGNTVAFALRNAMMVIGGTTLLLVTSPRLTGYVAIMLPLVIIPMVVLGSRVRKLSRETQDRIGDISVHVEESLSGLRTIQAYGLESNKSKAFQHNLDEALSAAYRRTHMRALLTALVIAMVFGAVVCVLWIGGREVITGGITAGALSAFVFYAVVVASAVGGLSEIIGDLQRAAGAAERVQELLMVEPRISAPENPLPFPEKIKDDITFDNVTFHYPTRPDHAALENFSLSIKPGERVALVGPSGAGKSTVFQLLMRFYDPSSGSVKFNGTDIRQFDPRSLRRAIGLVPQEPVIFSDNAWENIRCGREGAKDVEVLEAARSAAALTFLEELPNGMSSFLGEKGVRLSGGQKQRVAIARALLRDPAILLLDEATSALDAENERLVQEALGTLMQERTVVVIAHRLATVRQADRIIVMEQGRIIAQGKHEELMAEKGLYARLAELQLS